MLTLPAGPFQGDPPTMLHEPAADSGPDPASDYKTRLGIWMFLLYCVIYAGFVLTNVLTDGKAMEIDIAFGLNLAVVYGFGLILLALIMAVVYNMLCTAKEAQLAAGTEAGEGAA